MEQVDDSPPSAPPRRSLILLVDDDVELLSLLREAITGAFPRVRLRTAERVAGGKIILSDEAVDLLVSDIELPDGSGLDLIDYAIARQPSIRIVVISGSGLAERLGEQRLRHIGYVLTKPFDLDQFLDLVAKELRLLAGG